MRKFELSNNGYCLGRHSIKLVVFRPRRDIRKYAFSNRVADDWNCFPGHVVTVPSVNAFNNRLDEHWSDMGIDLSGPSSYKLYKLQVTFDTKLN